MVTSSLKQNHMVASANSWQCLKQYMHIIIYIPCQLKMHYWLKKTLITISCRSLKKIFYKEENVGNKYNIHLFSYLSKNHHVELSC